MGRCANEMAAIHLIKTYCLPILTYGCEAWTLSVRSLHTASVVWNNCFRIFRCCWRETTRLQYYCNVLPLSHLIDQRRLLFWQKTHYLDNVVLRTLSALKDNMLVAIGSKYDISSYNVSVKSAVLECVCNVIGVCAEVTVFEYAILAYFHF